MINPARRNAAVAAAILAVGIGGFTSAMMASGHVLADKPVQSLNEPAAPNGGQPIDLGTLTEPQIRDLLDAILPYYGKPAPKWCSEDMACWIGSTADNRDPASILGALRCDGARSSVNYSLTATDSDADGVRALCESTGQEEGK